MKYYSYLSLADKIKGFILFTLSNASKEKETKLRIHEPTLFLISFALLAKFKVERVSPKHL